MKKNLFILVLLLIYTGCINAQELASLESAKLFKSQTKNYGNTLRWYHGVIGADALGFYTLHKESLPILTRYNHNLDIEAEEDIFYNKGRLFANLEFIDIVHFNDSLYMFYSEGKMHETFLWVRSIDRQTLKLNSDERILDTIRHVKGFYPEFNVITSLERNTLLVVSRIDAVWNRTSSFGFRIYQHGLNPVWAQDETIQYNNKLPDNTEIVVDEVANVHILFRIYETTWLNHVLTDDAQKNEYAVLSFSQKGTKAVMQNISIDDKFIRDMNIFPGRDGSYIIAGFYSDSYKYGSDGIFISGNNPVSKEQRPLLLHPFKRELMEYLLKSRQIDNGYELYQLRTNYIRVLENGNVIVTAQQELQQDYDNMNDIMVFCFSPQGDYLWDRVVPKRQSGFEHSSYTIITHPNYNQVKLLFNENPKNDFSPKYSRNMKTYSFPGPYYMRLVTIDENGDIQQTRENESERRDPAPIPKKFYDLRNGSIVLSAKYYNEYQLMYLDLF